MSDNSDNLLLNGDSDTLPGFTISPLRLPLMFELQYSLETAYLAQRARAASLLPVEIGDRLIEHADNKVRKGVFRLGTDGYDDALHDFNNLHLLLTKCLLDKTPTINEHQARKLITPTNQFAIWRSCMKAAGYKFEKKLSPSPENPVKESLPINYANNLEIAK